MTKTSLLILLAVAISFAACKKSPPQPILYYYEEYNIGTRYSATGTPSDSISFIDSLQTSYTDFRGDTIDYGPDSRFFVSGPYYIRRYQHFEVYRYTK